MNNREKRIYLIQQTIRFGMGLKLPFSLSKIYYQMDSHQLDKNLEVIEQIKTMESRDTDIGPLGKRINTIKKDSLLTIKNL